MGEDMELEKILANYISDAKFEDLPNEPVDLMKKIILTILGTTAAGATAEGCREVVDQVREWGGKQESTILIHGGRVPAYNAALANSVLARAVDFCDGMVPGLHLGSSSVPTALAAAELSGGCTGKEFLTALVVGSEVAARLNLSGSAYNGFDPTGVCSIFGATGVASKIMQLNSRQTLDALALAFNRAGGSFQSNIDGSLAVRLIQGLVSQSAIICTQMAQRGLTGPKNFLEGVYGYFHLFAKDDYRSETVLADLGKKFRMTNVLLKKFPSCGGTLASTDAILDLMEKHNLVPEDVAKIVVRVVPATYNLTGHQFKIGENPKVNAQFNIQYCVANALLRKAPELKHFDESYIRDPRILEIVEKIQVIPDPKIMEHGHRAADMRVTTKDGKMCHTIIDIPRGYPEKPLTEEEHKERFQSCIRYGGKTFPQANIEKIISLVNQLEEVNDVRAIIPLLLSE
jgi:2-methylcitrate dehydratase PrpD